ncbi:MAG TPA: hypothetical protein VI320_19560, partial [Terracidiphilus sp.]
MANLWRNGVGRNSIVSIELVAVAVFTFSYYRLWREASCGSGPVARSMTACTRDANESQHQGSMSQLCLSASVEEFWNI